jgi:fimbrial chaperone protein
MYVRFMGQAACGLAFLIGATADAPAGVFAVSPVRATLTANQPVSALVVRNSGSDSTVVQLEVVSWAQEAGGKDVYTATKDILATPPIFTIPPGGSQVVRVGLRRTADPQRELTYRLFLQEVPPDKSVFQGLRVVLRMGIPVFVLPPVKAAPALRWQAARTPEGLLKLTLANHGNAHIQVAKSKLMLPGTEQVLASQDIAAYVLSGQSRDWLIKTSSIPQSGSALSLSAQTDAGDISAQVIVE